MKINYINSIFNNFKVLTLDETEDEVGYNTLLALITLLTSYTYFGK